MNKQKAKQRIQKLKNEINHYRYLYHVLDKQEISDGALDSLKNELFKLEQEYPDLITLDSPTQRVSGKPLEKFAKVTHSKPMMSLFDSFSEKDMRDWEERLKGIVKAKLKQVKMAELTLKNLKTDLNDILSGKRKITEEELLFENE